MSGFFNQLKNINCLLLNTWLCYFFELILNLIPRLCQTFSRFLCTFSTPEYFVGINDISLSCSFYCPRGMQTTALIHTDAFFFFFLFFSLSLLPSPTRIQLPLFAFTRTGSRHRVSKQGNGGEKGPQRYLSVLQLLALSWFDLLNGRFHGGLNARFQKSWSPMRKSPSFTRWRINPQ